MPATSVIIVGASAGGISAVRTLLNKFPESIPAEDGRPARDGHVHNAPPDYHLIIDRRCVRLTRGPREHAPTGSGRTRKRQAHG